MPGVRHVRTAKVLPDFPWDSLVPYRRIAEQHPDGLVDVSVGTPVDPTPQIIQEALIGSADAPGYPQTWGTPQLRQAVVDWFARRRGVPGLDPDAVLPTIGSKELVAWLPTLLGLGTGDRVGIPKIAYPTYDVGALMAGAEPVVVDGLAAFGPVTAASVPKLLWLNSPGNPTGKVLGIDHLRKVVEWARRHGVIVASDECYAELDWRTPGDVVSAQTMTCAPSVLHPEISGGSTDGLLAVYSLSKRSNLAGYRAGFVAGDPTLVAELLEVRKHAGMMVPTPVQRAMTVALGDDDHVYEQWLRYGLRRERLAAALHSAGFALDESCEAGLYLWVTRDEDCWDTIGWLAAHGILAAPGSFYGEAGRRHVRVALTASDERVDSACRRLATSA